MSAAPKIWPSFPSKWLRLAPWGHLRPPGPFFAALNLRCWILPSSVIAEDATLEINESTSQFPKMYTTYFLHSF